MKGWRQAHVRAECPPLVAAAIRGQSFSVAVALPCNRRYLSHSRSDLGSYGDTLCTSTSSKYSESKSTVTSNAPGTPSARVKPPSYLYRSFMGHSTRFASMAPPLTGAGITELEREPLTHSTPGRVNDHVCIGMVKALRWLADRLFRERHIHRATMLVTIAAAAPAAGSVAAYLRMFFKRRNSSSTSTGGAKTSIAAEASSPFLASVHSPSDGGAPFIRGTCRSFVTARPSLPMSPPSAAKERAGATLAHSYVDELRGLLTQCESHAVHYHVLSCMAEITHVERGFVFLLQALHFTIYLALFLFYPRMGFRLMAYTAEESSVVWTQMVNDIDLGKIGDVRVPQLALHYWGLDGAATAPEAPVPTAVVPNEQKVDLCKKSEGRFTEEVLVTDAEKLRTSRPGVDSADQSATFSTTSFDHATASSTASGIRDDSAVGRRGIEEHVIPTANVDTVPAAAILTLRDVALLIRSDEMVFRDLNHEFTDELDRQPSWLQRLVDSFNTEKQP
ncbi:hypothetical protein JKF63_00715 [Porcisia hertigi]|uniref:Alternative oxidase n=1 Tax=Porcisia hertigi TaxID=2761500 RepID=A0A836KXF2_9TRYP|nr:hypothetical protein JKF63_00715 [Porcisia hertigi]